MPIQIELDKEIVIDAFRIAAAQRNRAAAKFKPGSAAYNELAVAGKQLENEAARLQGLPTPLETAINSKK